MTTQDCFEVSVFTPPQTTTEKQTLAEHQNSPDKTKQSVKQHGKNGWFFAILQTNRERASDLAWLLQGQCLLHKQEEGCKQKLAFLLSSLVEIIYVFRFAFCKAVVWKQRRSLGQFIRYSCTVLDAGWNRKEGLVMRTGLSLKWASGTPPWEERE